MKNSKTKRLVAAAILSAIIVVLQLMAEFIPLGFVKFAPVLAPIVLGGALYGRRMGSFLGLVFSVVVLMLPSTQAFFSVNILATIIIVLTKGTLGGFLAACVYKLLAKKSELAGVVSAGIVMPIVNTGIFVLGASFFFLPVFGIGADKGGLMAIIPIFLIIAMNFIIELAVNLLLSTGLVTAIKATRKL